MAAPEPAQALRSRLRVNSAKGLAPRNDNLGESCAEQALWLYLLGQLTLLTLSGGSGMSASAILYQLQNLDDKIDQSRRRLTEIEKELAASSPFAAVERELSDFEDALKAKSRELKNLEWDTGEITKKIRDINAKLYGGQISNPKELSSLQQEVNSLSTRKSELEDKTLELMAEIEELQAKTGSSKENLNHLKNEDEVHRHALVEENRLLKTHLESLEKEHQVLTTQIEKAALELYDRLRLKSGKAVAVVEKGICGGCRITVPAIELARAKGNSDLVRCESCGRILYVVR